MAANIGSAAFVLSTNSSRLLSGLDAATSKMNSWRTQNNANLKGAFTGVASQAQSTFAAVSSFAAGPMAAFAAITAAIATAMKALQDISEIASQGRQAESIGVSPEFFTGLAGAAKQFGVDSNGVYEGLINMSKKAKEALTNENIAMEFAKIGIDAKKFANLGVEEQFATVQAALEGITDPAARVQAGMLLLGEEFGKKFAPALAMGTEELKKLMKEFEVGKESMTKMDEADKAMKQAGASINAVWKEIIVAVTPVVTLISKGLTQALKAPLAVIKVLGDALNSVFDALVKNISEAVDGLWEFLGLADKADKDNKKPKVLPSAIDDAKKLQENLIKEQEDKKAAEEKAKDEEKAKQEAERKAEQAEKDRLKLADVFANAWKEKQWGWQGEEKKQETPKDPPALTNLLKNSKEALKMEQQWRSINDLAKKPDTGEKQLTESKKQSKLLADVLRAVEANKLELVAI